MALPEIGNDALDLVLAYAPSLVERTARAEVEPGNVDLMNLLSAMEVTGFTAPFDWQAEFEDRREELERFDVIDDADLETLRKIVTAHVRIGRFDDGHLERLAASGYLTRCLSRLRELRNDR